MKYFQIIVGAGVLLMEVLISMHYINIKHQNTCADPVRDPGPKSRHILLLSLGFFQRGEKGSIMMFLSKPIPIK